MKNHLIALVALAHAGLATDEVFELSPSGCVQCGTFGQAVAVSGNLAVIGTDSQDNGPASGSAYVFDVNTGQRVAKLLPGDGAAGDQFGAAVAIDGNTVLVGAPYDDDFGPGSGSVYVFDALTGQQLAKLVPTDGHFKDHFGSAIALVGTTAVIGSPDDNDNGKNSGSVYVFDTTTGKQRAKLVASDGRPQDTFGSSLAIDGGSVLVGARYHDDLGALSGAAYLYDLTTGLEVAKLLAPDGSSFDLFGWSVALDGPVAAIGAPADDDSGPGEGSVYLFETSTGKYTGKVLAPTSQIPTDFGAVIALDGDTLLVGDLLSSLESSYSGVVYSFDIPSGMAPRELLLSTPMTGDWLGQALAVDGETVVAGAPGRDSIGAAYVFDLGLDPIGTSYCGPATPNSTGLAAELAAGGSEAAADNLLRLTGDNLPPNVPVFFLNSRSAGFSVPPGSQGSLCLGSSIGRYVEDLRNSGSAGSATVLLDLVNTPTPFGPVAVRPGDTWYFQAWYRDSNPGATSNFTDGVWITFN